MCVYSSANPWGGGKNSCLNITGLIIHKLTTKLPMVCIFNFVHEGHIRIGKKISSLCVSVYPTKIVGVRYSSSKSGQIGSASIFNSFEVMRLRGPIKIKNVPKSGKSPKFKREMSSEISGGT